MESVNWSKFRSDFVKHKHKANIGDRELSRLISVSIYYINSLMLDGECRDIHSFIAICKWMEKPVTDYIVQ
jgi:hypothetical protein